MSVQLVKGVNPHVTPTEKYKAVRLLIRFNTRLNHETIIERALSSSLMEINSLNHPNQVKLSERLAELYGTNFGIDVSKKGNQHWLNISVNVVNDHYLQDSQVLVEAVDLLKEIIFAPNTQAGQFEAETFQREKENLKVYLESIVENKQTYASLAFQSVYLNQSEDQKIPGFGTVATLTKETTASLAAYYQKMLAGDQVDIFALGDVNKAELVPLSKQLPLTPREEGRAVIFYNQPIRNAIEERTEREVLAQSELNLAYNMDIYYGDSHYSALQVFNGIFGGFPHSELFMNVREKGYLVYYASSNIDTFRGFMTVQTGIDGKNRNQILRLISTELENVRLGKISELEIERTRAMLKNQYILTLDNAGVWLEKEYLNQLMPQTILTVEEWTAWINVVTIPEIQEVARRLEFQATFFLEGETEND